MSKICVSGTATSVPLVGFVQPSAALAQTYARASASVAVLNTQRSIDGHIVTGFGTSFCLDEHGLFLTARHVVEGHLSSFIVLDRLYDTELVAVDEEQDLALVEVKDRTCEFSPLHLLAASLVRDELVIGLGYPAGRLAISLSGYVAMYHGRFVDGVDPDAPNITCPALPQAVYFLGAGLDLAGFSGGPVLNEAGAVVAVTSTGDGDAFVAGAGAEGVRGFVESFRARQAVHARIA